MTLSTTIVTGVLYNPAGAVLANKRIEIRPLSGGISSVAGGARIPLQMVGSTDENGAIGLQSENGFTVGVPLSMGKYHLNVDRMTQVLTIDAAMVASGAVNLQDTLVGETEVVPRDRGLPPGGVFGQVLAKTSSLEYAVSWVTPTNAETEDGATLVTWESVTDKPATFPPTSHQHQISDISGLQEAISAEILWGDISQKPELYSRAQVDTLVQNFETSSQIDQRDLANRDRGNHEGTQAAETISDFNAAVDARLQSSDKVSSSSVTNIVSLTQTEYDALETISPTTLYVIVE